jgi:pimeloyl-[acyl-carrier protein] methyl ester esterase
MTKTTLVLLPALDGTDIFFQPLIDVLPVWINPVVVTYPQSGRNDYGDLYPLIEEAIEKESEFFVLGWSFSGPLALMLARNNPGRVRGVILCASFVTSPLPLLKRFRFGIVGPVIAAARALWRTRFWLWGYPSDHFREAKSKTWRCVSSRILAARGRAIMKVDARPLLRDCALPLMYLAGSHDRVVRSHSAQEIMRIAPSTRVVTIEGDHYAIFTNPEAASAGLVSFIRSDS